jgi:DNA repair protein RadC
MILHLDSKHRILRDEVVSVGALTGTVAHPREVFKSAIKESAHSVILVHNHPSGDPTPSDEDLQMTKRLIESGEILGIKVLDHVIIGREGYWSWNEKT